MTTSIATPPKLQFFTANGVPLSGGKLYTYAAGTTTPLATYTSSSGGTANTNPIILDSRGEANVWLGAAPYKMKLTSSTDVEIWTVDNLAAQATLAMLAASNGSSLIGYTQGGTGAVTTTVQAKLREFVSVQDFGAIGNGVANDTAAVQAFFNYIAANNVGTAYCDGRFLVSSGIYYGDGTNQAATLQIVGYAEFIASTAIDILVDFRSASNLVWDGGIRALGTGGTSYASRTCRVGIRIAGSGGTNSRQTFVSLRAQYFYDTGISVQTLSTLTDLGNVRAAYCGSGATGFSLTAGWSNPVNSGSSNSINQRTVIDVTVLPPTSLESPEIVNISGQPYYVASVDTVNSKLTVFPWVDSTLTSGSLTYMFGGGVYIQGSDSGIIGANQIDSTGCGFGLWTTALYGPVVNRLVAQNCGSGFAYGFDSNASNVGFTLNGFYAENNIFDLIKVTSSFSAGGTNIHGGVIMTDYENNYAKWASCAAPRSSGNVLLASGTSSNQVAVISAGTSQEYITTGSNAQETASTYSLFPTDSPKSKIFSKDSWTINVQTPDADLNRLFGYGFDTLTIIGATNTNGSPTGTFTFNAPSGYTVNGGTSAAFAGFTGPAVFQIYYQVSTLDILIRCSTYAPSGSATYNPPSLNDGDGVTTTVTVTGAVLGDFAEASFSNSLQGIMMTAFVSAADTVSVRFQNETGGVLDLASGTLRARVRKAV
jgi:hypothetical protein